MNNKSQYYKYGLILMFIFFISQNIFTIENSNQFGYTDINNYLIIAKNRFYGTFSFKVPLHHLERWPIHSFIGEISYLMNIEIHSTYIIFQIFILINIFFVIGFINESYITKLSIFSIILFNPYLFRLYNCIPEMISDTLFVMGSLFLIISLIYSKKILNIISLIILIISRQTVILLFPIIIIMFLLKIINKKQLIVNILILFLGILIIKFSTTLIYGKQDNKYIVYHLIDGWEKLNKVNFTETFDFLARFIILIITTLPIFIFINKKDIKNNYIWIIFFLIINIQPLISGPLITSGNIQRLGALGIPFLIPIIIQNKNRKKDSIIFILLNILLSFHHRFSIINKIEFSIFIFETILFIIPIIILSYKYAK